MLGDFFGGRYGFCPQFSGGVEKLKIFTSKKGGGGRGCKSFMMWIGYQSNKEKSLSVSALNFLYCGR